MNKQLQKLDHLYCNKDIFKTLYAYKITNDLKFTSKKIILTLGVFDGLYLHKGHLWYLKQAQKIGGIRVVGINTDHSVQKIKTGRPIIPFYLRALRVASLPYIDYVLPFDGDGLKLAQKLRPQIVLSSTTSNLYWSDESIQYRQFIQSYGGKIITLDKLPGSSSTTEFLEKFLKRQIVTAIPYNHKRKVFYFHSNKLFSLETQTLYHKILKSIEKNYCDKILILNSCGGYLECMIILNTKNRATTITSVFRKNYICDLVHYNTLRALAFTTNTKIRIYIKLLKLFYLTPSNSYDYIYLDEPTLDIIQIIPTILTKHLRKKGKFVFTTSSKPSAILLEALKLEKKYNLTIFKFKNYLLIEATLLN